MKHLHQAPIATLVTIMLLTTLPGCKEENDIIKQPTATSTTLTGTVTDSAGDPIPGINISVDYRESYWLGPQLTRHKAEGKTASDGTYRLFFETHDDEFEPHEPTTPTQYYITTFDLSRLPSEKHILPSDLDPDNSDNALTELWYSKAGKGETLTLNILIPQKTTVSVKIQANDLHDSSDAYAVANTFAYGKEGASATLRTPVTLHSGGTTAIEIPCALHTKNSIVLERMEGGHGSFEPVTEPQEITPNPDTPLSIDLIDTTVPEESLFSLTQQPESPHPSPFEKITFRIVDRSGNHSLTTPKFCNFYDSITWSVDGYAQSRTIFKKTDNSAGTSGYTSQWGGCFFEKGPVTSRLHGYKNGKEVHTDSLTTTLHQRDFLCFDWDTVDLSLSGESFVAYSPIMPLQTSFRIDQPQEENGHIFIRVRFSHNRAIPTEQQFQLTKESLTLLMDHFLGNSRPIGREESMQLFYRIADNETPVMLWQTETTNALLMIEEADETASTPRRYVVLAEKR